MAVMHMRVNCQMSVIEIAFPLFVIPSRAHISKTRPIYIDLYSAM